MQNTICIIPIYKEIPLPYEIFSLRHSLFELRNSCSTCFIHPQRNFATGFYNDFFRGDHQFIGLDNKYFQGQYCYNNLLYEKSFYRQFSQYSHMLILQTDAIVLDGNKLEEWINSPYSFVGAPEDTIHEYKIAGFLEGKYLAESLLLPITFQGLNGGLSLRSIPDMIALLEEFPSLARYSKEKKLGEDLFFCLLSKLSKQEIFFPNELLASSFALTNNFQEWVEYNKCPPFGLHRWYSNRKDASFTLRLIKQLRERSQNKQTHPQLSNH